MQRRRPSKHDDALLKCPRAGLRPAASNGAVQQIEGAPSLNLNINEPSETHEDVIDFKQRERAAGFYLKVKHQFNQDKFKSNITFIKTSPGLTQIIKCSLR